MRQGNLSRVLFRFPESVRLKRVWGADVGGWQIDGDGDDRTLTVFLRRTVDDRTLVFADLFLPEAGAGDEVSFNMPDFSPQNITRESGQIVFLTDDQREIRVNESTGITRTNGLTGELPEELNPDHLPIQGTYRFTSRPWSLSLSAALRAPESRAIAEYGMFVSHRKILLGARLQFDLAGAPRRLLRTVLPHDFLMVDLRSPDVQDWFVEDGELVLDLGQPRLGRVTVTFEGHIHRDATDTEAVLETPLLQNVDRLETTLAVWMEDGLTGSLEGFEGWRSVQAGDLSPELRALHHEPVQFAFRTTALEPELIILLLNRAQPRLACDAVTLVAVSDSSLDYGLTLRWSIERAAADQLVFTTDGWLEGRLDFTGPGIRQTSSAIQDDGRIRWTVEMQDAVRGQYVLAAAVTLPPPANGIVLAPDIRFEQSGTEPDEFSDVNVQQSFAVLVNLSSAQMVPTAGQTHEVVQKENLPLVLRNELVAQAMEMARLHSGEELSWQMQRVTEQMTATATVMLADLQTMLAADGSWRTQASYRVRNRGHQFLAVRLPGEARLLSVMVKDQPSRVSRTMLNDEPVLLVPLPQTSAADLSFNAVLVLQGQFARSLPRTMAVNGEHFSLPVPSIVTPNESPDYGVPVFHTSWKVTLPDEFAASPVEGDLTTVEYQPSGASDLYALDQTLQELAELNRLLGDSRTSYSQRSLAAGNLKKLESELEEQSERGYFYLGSLPSSKQEELAQEKEHLLSESRQNTAQFQQEYSDSLGVVDRDGDGVIEVPQLSNRAFINSNGIMIQQDNNDFSTSSQEHLGTANTFRFNVTPAPAADDKVPGRSRGKSSPAPQRRSRSELMDDLTRQESLFGNAPSDDAPQSGESEFWRQSELTEGFVDRPTSTPLQGGRGGFGGGGFGGERGFDRLNISGFAIQNLGDDAASFTPTGGLSLPIDIPVAGETLTFTRVGGNPALTLAIRPRESVSYGFRWLWTLLWIALGAFVLWQLTSRQHAVNWAHVTGIGCLLLGLFTLLLMPSPAAWIGLPVILIGCLLTLGSPQRTVN
ncbi:MAG: hypothetical protein R3C02_08895 [Planctomycetaceae bacterium]